MNCPLGLSKELFFKSGKVCVCVVGVRELGCWLSQGSLINTKGKLQAFCKEIEHFFLMPQSCNSSSNYLNRETPSCMRPPVDGFFLKYLPSSHRLQCPFQNKSKEPVLVF